MPLARRKRIEIRIGITERHRFVVRAEKIPDWIFQLPFEAIKVTLGLDYRGLLMPDIQHDDLTALLKGGQSEMDPARARTDYYDLSHCLFTSIDQPILDALLTTGYAAEKKKRDATKHITKIVPLHINLRYNRALFWSRSASKTLKLEPVHSMIAISSKSLRRKADLR
jgi:hypothetical protein